MKPTYILIALGRSAALLGFVATWKASRLGQASPRTRPRVLAGADPPRGHLWKALGSGKCSAIRGSQDSRSGSPQEPDSELY